MQEPVPSKSELAWADLFPSRRPGLKGTFGILNHTGEKYAYDSISPMYAFFYMMLNRMDGKSSLLEIVDAVKAEALCSNYPVFSNAEINRFLELLRKDGVIELKKKNAGQDYIP